MTNDEKEYEDNKAQLEAQLEGLARLGSLIGHQRDTDYPDRLSERIEERREMEQENMLAVECDRTLRFVLCTGGPHAEIVWEDGRNPYAVCYGWFGKGKFERGLTDDEQTGLDQIGYGDFDETWAMMTGGER